MHDYDWADDSRKCYELWININRARLLIVRALIMRSTQNGD
jgi:hypothetical protein